jgi:L-cysteine:1D-myo-inositol 2-amino-2-deoxy-alpha-D-glucopyranoside ligase
VTPYDSTHLGHAFTFLSYDVLMRRLIDTGRRVKCVRNVTDVDDPLFAKARELGVHWLDLAFREEARLNDDLAALNALEVYSRPRASSAIPDIRGFIGMVLDRGYAYRAGGSVYFDVSRSEKFGALSGLDRDTMIALARERGGNVDDPNKRDPLDFVLWQPSSGDEPAWDTLWGAGRPGWHIECSALALRELGTTIDLHGGGTDLIFPHHECERAQSEAATGRWCGWTDTRCRRVAGTSSSSMRCAASTSRWRSAWGSSSTTTAPSGNGTTNSSCAPDSA